MSEAFTTNPAQFGFGGQPHTTQSIAVDGSKQYLLFIEYYHLNGKKGWATFKKVFDERDGRLVYLIDGILAEEEAIKHYNRVIYQMRMGDRILRE